MRIPAPAAQKVEIRIADLLDRDCFGERWSYWMMNRRDDGFWECDIAALGMADGDYEYEFVIDGDRAGHLHSPCPLARRTRRTRPQHTRVGCRGDGRRQYPAHGHDGNHDTGSARLDANAAHDGPYHRPRARSGAPFLPAAPAAVGSCQPTPTVEGDALTVARWVLQLFAWALAALLIAGFTGIVRKT